MREVAKHLSAMGRHGDTMLVHMSPQEVSALQGIASINDTHLTHNPHTGLPEAFNLGGFFKSLLPTLAGAAATTLTGGALAPVLAGAATGAALNGGNPLMGALTGGLGGFGGMGIADALKSAAGAGASVAPTGVANATNAAANQTAGEVAKGTLTNVGNPLAENSMANALAQPGVMGSGNMYSGFPQGVSGNVQGMVGGQSGANQLSSGLQTAAAQPNASGLASLSQGAQNLGTSAGREAFVKSLGGTGPNADLIAAGKAGMPLAMAGLAGIEPPKMPEEDKYDPYAKLNLSGDSGLRFFAEGGDVNEMPDPGSNPLEDAQEARSYGIGGLSYAGGGGIFGGSGLNLNTSDAPRPNPLSFMDAFINRQQYQRPQYQRPTQTSALPFYNMLNRATQPVQAPPRPPGPFGLDSGVRFAKGGYLDGPGDGMSDSIPASIEGKQPARLADGEFVVPADVVSHLGNGSTKAGAQRLYGMLDKVRKARTGTTQQGRQINPKKYLPA
jgi:hypothetical protein